MSIYSKTNSKKNILLCTKTSRQRIESLMNMCLFCVQVISLLHVQVYHWVTTEQCPAFSVLYICLLDGRPIHRTLDLCLLIHSATDHCTYFCCEYLKYCLMPYLQAVWPLAALFWQNRQFYMSATHLFYLRVHHTTTHAKLDNRTEIMAVGNSHKFTNFTKFNLFSHELND